MINFQRGVISDPEANEPILNGVIVWEPDGQIVFAGSADELPATVRDGRIELAQVQIEMAKVGSESRVIIPGGADTHTHIFQPEGIPGELIKNTAPEGAPPQFEGWLPETLKFETAVRREPEEARAIARYRFQQYIEHGITASLEYTTSSVEAARIVLEEAWKAGLGGRIKVGYVAMDQEVDFIPGVELEVKDSKEQDAVLAKIRELAQDFPSQVVIIDRFPIAVSSPYRQKLIQLAQELGVLYETHVDESEGEWNIHNGSYTGRRILQVLSDDGAFADGMKVGLAHGIHTRRADFDIVEKAVRREVLVNVRFCPDSNGNLGSHNWGGRYVPMPYQAWKDAGATVTLGTDKGAGTGWSIFAEALKERARLHVGAAPTERELLAMATSNGSRSLGLNDTLQRNNPANFIVVNAASPFRTELPRDTDSLAAVVLRAAQNPKNITRVVVNGATLKC